jgi:hypothetical protein
VVEAGAGARRRSARGGAAAAAARSLVALALLAAPAAAENGGPPFTDVTEEVGIRFHHWNGMSGRLYYPEVVGSGGALFDYDGDGDLDVYLVQGQMLGPDRTIADALLPPREPLPLRGRLYRNELVAAGVGGGRLRFTDVTDTSRLDAQAYGMGVAAGDYDNDGHLDLYLANFGANQLWRNRGDGTFENTTTDAGVGDPRWSVSASFVDLDNDGFLDLAVANYLDYSYGVHKTCLTERGERDYCLPNAYRPAVHRLYRNQRDGTFRDVTMSAGMGEARGNGLGVSTADLDRDGDLDLFVANDLMPNFLWINQGDGRVVEEGLMRGAALDANGRALASMGVDAADFDRDGDLDLFTTHFSRETNTLYVNDGKGFFYDGTEEAELGTPSWPHTGFGTGFFDYDLDGWLDLVVVNGLVTFPVGADRSKNPFPLDEPNQLFHNLGTGRFRDVTAEAGPAFAGTAVGRGAALGDVDNDGDVDLLITNNNGPARLLRTEADVARRPWVGLRLYGGAALPRDLVGAEASVRLPGAPPLVQLARADGSYASASDPRVVLALGESFAALDSVAVEVKWPGGKRERFDGVPVRRYTTLTAGQGQPLP